jgi:hypothetical protein
MGDPKLADRHRGTSVGEVVDSDIAPGHCDSDVLFDAGRASAGTRTAATGEGQYESKDGSAMNRAHG